MPTRGTTDHTNKASPIPTANGETTQIVYTSSSNPPTSDSFRVSVTDKRDGHTREALISIVGPAPEPTMPNPVDDLSYSVSGNTITLWSGPL